MNTTAFSILTWCRICTCVRARVSVDGLRDVRLIVFEKAHDEGENAEITRHEKTVCT